MSISLPVLEDAVAEIRSLRQQNEVLLAKAYVVDVFAKALGVTGDVPVSKLLRPDPLYFLDPELEALRRAAEEAKSREPYSIHRETYAVTEAEPDGPHPVSPSSEKDNPTYKSEI